MATKKQQPKPGKTADMSRNKQFQARELDRATKQTGQRGNLEQNANKGVRPRSSG